MLRRSPLIVTAFTGRHCEMTIFTLALEAATKVGINLDITRCSSFSIAKTQDHSMAEMLLPCWLSWLSLFTLLAHYYAVVLFKNLLHIRPEPTS